MEASLILGAHMSIAGGAQRALERAGSIQCEAVQIFTKNQLRWSAPPLQESSIRAFRRLKLNFSKILAHGSYLINLASPEQDIFEKSVEALREEIRRCRLLDIDVLILHPGSHRGAGIDWGIQRAVEGVRSAYGEERENRLRLTLETTAGGGATLGARFEQLRDLLEALQAAAIPAGICVDTCHMFAAGYELRNRKGYESTWRRFERVIGLQHLLAVHLNDSRGSLGSGIDRHEHIGKGEIGLPGFRRLIRDSRLTKIPGILETPKSADMHEDVENLQRLRALSRP